MARKEEKKGKDREAESRAARLTSMVVRQVGTRVEESILGAKMQNSTSILKREFPVWMNVDATRQERE